MTHFFLAHAGAPDWTNALESCSAQMRDQMGEASKPSLGWCYFSDYYAEAAGSLLEALKEKWPGVHWVGAAGVGIGAGSVEYFDEPAMALMLTDLPPVSFRVFSGSDLVEAGSTAFEPFTALVHAAGGGADLSAKLRSLSEKTTAGYLFGGLSSARNKAFCFADELRPSGLSGVAFGPEVSIVSRVTQGCKPIGPERVVTRAEGNYLVTLDNAKALECAAQDLGLSPDVPDAELGDALGQTLVGIISSGEDASSRPGQFGSNTEVRHIVGVARKAGVLVIAEQLSNGARLAFCQRNAQAAKQDLLRIVDEVRAQAQASGGVRGALYISCSGRGGPHFGARHAEFAMVKEALGEVPLIGFFAGGEIARHHLYGYTGVLTVFTGAQ